MKKRIITVLMSLAIVLLMTVAAEATTATKPITVDYVDIQLYVNGNAVSLQDNEEPFIYNGRTFVPIRMVSEALNQNVEWIDSIKAVKISGENSATTDLLTQKEKEIQDLKLEIESLKNTIDSLEADDDEISDLEDALISGYDYLEDVNIEDISLDGDEDDIDVAINVDLDDYGDEWEELDDSDIEDWIEDLVSSIQDELSDDTVVSGEIIDTDSDDVLVEFYKDGDYSLDVEFQDDDDEISDLEDALISEYDYLEDVNIEDISLDGDEGDIDATINVDLDDYGDEWEELDDSDIEDWIEDLVSSIQDELSDDTVVSGEIIDTDSDDVLVEFYKDGDYSLDVEFQDEDYRGGSSDSDLEDVLDSLEDDSFYVDDIEFTMDISYDDDDESVTAYLDAVDDDASSEWEYLSSSRIDSDVTDICEEIADAFDDDADIRLDTVTVYFYDEDSDLLDSFDYDVDDGDLY
ncbi:hypothetical protein Psch_02145 [Pelotomaculum schinkii]|uniref:Copper amine oxidase-like N-terminal domain-containing protein n=1 Tax=Pelotomaculum schinkii TaxID=78350 RepID=A0A4Y7RIF2_9FIRM|nr:stalk domain-containing protein [Pelotomaculum schinkii]TEB08581.1 hypothetical protein Psch_02145 [Pelotomaculum schinkii]